jgi:type IV pilus assembly protein PilN
MDLEAVMPTGVQVTSIEPGITPEGDVNIRLRVTGNRDLTVDFVRNLEQSRRFLQPRLANETAQTQEQGRVMNVGQPAVSGGVEFVILSGYNPLPGAAKEDAKDKKPAPKDNTTPKPAKPVVHKATAKPVGVRPAPNKAAVPGGVR